MRNKKSSKRRGFASKCIKCCTFSAALPLPPAALSSPFYLFSLFFSFLFLVPFFFSSCFFSFLSSSRILPFRPSPCFRSTCFVLISRVIQELFSKVNAWGYMLAVVWIIHHHQSLNHEGRWGTRDDFAISFIHFPLFSTALWDLPNSRPVHSLMLSSHLFLCLPCLLPPFTVPCTIVLARPDERETWPYTVVCVSLRSSGGLRVVRLPAGSWRLWLLR